MLKAKTNIIEKEPVITRKNLVLVLLMITYLLAAYYLLNYYGISCVFLEFFNVPCPGCGMTRAVLSLLRLDFRSAFEYNPVAIFLPYIFMYLLFNFKHKIHNVVLLFIAGFAIVNWIYKLLLFY